MYLRISIEYKLVRGHTVKTVGKVVYCAHVSAFKTVQGRDFEILEKPL